MAFLFKSKKHQERALAGGRDGPNSSQGSVQSPDARSRVVREEKGPTHRSTPTGSLNSIDNDASNASPDQGFNPGPPRRAQTGDPPAQAPPDTQQQVSGDDTLPGGRERPAAASQNLFAKANSCAIVSQRSLPTKPELLVIPMVATEAQLHLVTPRPLSPLWRSCQRYVVKRRRHVRDGGLDQQLHRQR